MKLIISLLFLMSFSNSFSQNIVRTERSQFGRVTFFDSLNVGEISDSSHVDGYVKKIGKSSFLFPVGSNGVYRPFAADGDGTTGAYFLTSPSSASVPVGGGFPVAKIETVLRQVSDTEFWDINGDNASRISLSWNSRSDLTTLTNNSIRALTIVGWNSVLGRWEQVLSKVDEVSILGTPSTMTAGSVTTIEALIPNKYAIYTLGCLANSSPLPEYEGVLEVAGCAEITGWVWDKNYPNASLVVELLDGQAIIGTSTANFPREDLKTAGKGTGQYGFRFSLPYEIMSDGVNHAINVRVKSTNFLATGGPKQINCNFAGTIDVASCNEIRGWLVDNNDLQKRQEVELIDGTTVLQSTIADIYRADLKDKGVGDGKCGFSFVTPFSLKDGGGHKVGVRLKGAEYYLRNSGNYIIDLVCPPPQFLGSFEYADCDVLRGWVWDRLNPNGAMTVEVYEGTTIYATALANTYRADIKNAGAGTGNYGFSIAIPAALKDGKPHQLSVRVKDGGYILGGSPRAVTCAGQSYLGSFEYADCDVLRGWVWDRLNPNGAMTVEVYEGTTIYATALANTYRADIKNAGAGTGNYGFSIAIPAALKDGKPHQLSVRVKNGGYILGGSPRAVTCAGQSYLGSFEYADCDVLRGWVWDRLNPNGAMTVEVYEGTTIYATALANTYRADIKNAGAGTGNYGFSIAIPAALKDGKPHQLSVRVKNGGYILGGSPRAVTCAGQSYLGSFEYADCDVLRGWVWDRLNPNGAMTVEVYEGTTIYATALANTYRADIKNAGAGTGNYGFSIAIPAALKDGKPHQLSVRVKNGGYILGGSPRAVTCAGQSYLGSFEYADCDVLRGWVWDRLNPNGAMTVEVYEGTTIYATALANTYRADIKNAGAGTGNYGFSIAIPAALKDGKPHQLSVRVKDGGYILGGSPRAVTCAGQSYSGSFEYADCDVLRGWVWDRLNPNGAMTVEVYEGTTIYATALANTYRADIKNAGAGTGNYGFSIAIPAALKDGKPHQLSVRVKDGGYILGGSPRAVTCAGQSYLGSFEYADCDVLRGWVWDRLNPNGAMTVEVYEGTTIYATALANTYRADIKNAGAGTGNYGFSIAIPAALKDGKPHQLSVRVKDGGYILGGSPRAVTCAGQSYLGSFEYADCDVLRGWVWDRLNPNGAMTVEVYEGTTIYATALANTYRADIKNAGAGTGNYGFSIAIPAALKDGKPHQLSVRVKNGGYTLGGSPREISCNSSARINHDLNGAASVRDSPTTSNISDFVVFPNPSSAVVYAKLTIPRGEKLLVLVYSLQGIIVWQKTIIGNGEKIVEEIDLGKCDVGPYLISATSLTFRVTQTVIISR